MLNYRKYFIQGAYLALIFSTLSVFSIFILDKEFTLWNHALGLDKWVFLRYITENTYKFAFFYMVFLIFFPDNLSSNQKIAKLLYFTLMVLIALWFKTKLKIFFGRDWPLNWSGAHGGLIPDGIYQFNILKFNDWHGSFPSGHATFASVTFGIMSLLYPTKKFIWFTITSVMIIAILLLNYHFISDCLAGIALGLFVAYYSVGIYNLVISKFVAIK